LKTYSHFTSNPVSVHGRSAKFKHIYTLFWIANGGSRMFIVYPI
jgi:hypothetical protein